MMIYKVIYKAIMASNGTIMYLLFHNVFINDSRPNVSGKVSYVSELMQLNLKMENRRPEGQAVLKGES